MKKIKLLIASVYVALLFSIATPAFARFESICGQGQYFIDTGAGFWSTKKTGGCDYVDEYGCLVHVEIYTKYRFFIPSRSETVEIFC